jgi:hypothetical protein
VMKTSDERKNRRSDADEDDCYQQWFKEQYNKYYSQHDEERECENLYDSVPATREFDSHSDKAGIWTRKSHSGLQPGETSQLHCIWVSC